MNKKHSIGKANGFTLIEVLIVVVVIIIMSGIGLGTWFSLLQEANDSERTSDTASIARYLEKQYTELASSSYPTYPSVNTLTADMTELANSGIKDALVAPDKNVTTSLSAASSNASPPSGITIDTYIYQPLLASGALCTNRSEAQPCVRYRLWYLLEQNTSSQVIESKHQQ